MASVTPADAGMHEGKGATAAPPAAVSKRRGSVAYMDTDSVWFHIASSMWFQNSTLVVIVINALWIGVDVEWNHESKRQHGKLPLEPASTVVENSFCIYFTIELLIRFLSYKTKFHCIYDLWFCFDGFLVACMVFENWVMALVEQITDPGEGGQAPLGSLSAFRLLRLLRLTRMARLMRAVPELMTLVKGMIMAARAVYIILMFLMLVVYVFAIVFTSTLTPMKEDYEPDDDPCADPSAFFYFGSMGSSMMTLFTNGVLGDNLAQTLDAIKAQSLLLFWAFILFTVLSAMTLLNMLIGVLCEVISTAASEEADADKITDFRSCVSRSFKQMDYSEDGLVTETEWDRIKDKKIFRKELLKLGVEEDNMDKRLQQMSDSLFAVEQGVPEWGDPKVPQNIGLSFDDFCSKVKDLTPEVPASALDIEILTRQVSTEDRALKCHLQRLETMLYDMVEEETSGQQHAWSEPAPVPPASAGEKWLDDLPTELLFHVLKTRAPPT